MFADQPARFSSAAGIPGHCVENVVLENITNSFPGGGTQEDANREVPEDIARYGGTES